VPDEPAASPMADAGDARPMGVLDEANEGRALHARAVASATAADEAILAALPKNKRANFVDALVRISKALDPDAKAAAGEKKKAKDKKKKKKKKKK
jgi:hypothetical protein